MKIEDIIQSLKSGLKNIDEDFPIIGGYIVSKAIDNLLIYAKKINASNKKENILHVTAVTEPDVLKSSIRKMLSFCSTENIITILNPKNIDRLYVPQELYVVPVRQLIKKSAAKRKTADSVLASLEDNLIIQANSGTGKSTFIKNLILNFYNDKYPFKKQGLVPFLVRA